MTCDNQYNFSVLLLLNEDCKCLLRMGKTKIVFYSDFRLQKNAADLYYYIQSWPWHKSGDTI